MNEDSRYIDNGVQAGEKKRMDTTSKYATKELTPQSVMAVPKHQITPSFITTTSTSKQTVTDGKQTTVEQRQMTMAQKQMTMAKKASHVSANAQPKQSGNQSQFNADEYKIIESKYTRQVAAPKKEVKIAEKKVVEMPPMPIKTSTEEKTKKTTASTTKTTTPEIEKHAEPTTVAKLIGKSAKTTEDVSTKDDKKDAPKTLEKDKKTKREKKCGCCCC